MGYFTVEQRFAIPDAIAPFDISVAPPGVDTGVATIQFSGHACE